MRSLRKVLLATAFGLITSAAFADRAATPAPRGRPTVVLDRLVLPDGTPNSVKRERELKYALRREARRADWGANAESRIEFRVFVKELSIRAEPGVVRVRCTAFGKLPSGQAAKSHLVMGGDPKQREKVVKRVLEMVARGVVTRLAELERARRDRLKERYVKRAVEAGRNN